MATKWHRGGAAESVEDKVDFALAAGTDAGF